MTPDHEFNARHLAKIMPRADVGRWFLWIRNAMDFGKIDTPARRAAFLAQIAHESGELKRVEENLNYSAKRLREVFGKYFPDDHIADTYAGKPELIANRVYANRLGNGNEASGDGWKYRGRGLIQLTGRDNYNLCNAVLRPTVDLVGTPDAVTEPGMAAASAVWFWNRKGLSAKADEGTKAAFEWITLRINGGLNGMADREAYWKRAKEVLEVSP
jgi:putative chitinase